MTERWFPHKLEAIHVYPVRWFMTFPYRLMLTVGILGVNIFVFVHFIITQSWGFLKFIVSLLFDSLFKEISPRTIGEYLNEIFGED